MARIAIVGSGISGLYAARLLGVKHAVTLYESDTRLGGHTDTHFLNCGDGSVAVDSGFIVFNRVNYPYFCALLDELGVSVQASDMSFSVQDTHSGMEYCASPVWQDLFARRRNWVSPAFYFMLKDLRRFYRDAQHHYDAVAEHLTLGDYLRQHNYNRYFSRWYLLPLAAALWSASCEQIADYPVRYLLQFMYHHQMLQLKPRPQWLTVGGGSQSYVRALHTTTNASFRLGDRVLHIRREPNGVWLRSHRHEMEYDGIVLACHSDQALRLLGDATPEEQTVLGDIAYQDNDVVLHCDTSLLPRKRRNWASWNARLSQPQSAQCTVSYYMNRLQNLSGDEHYIVSLNQNQLVREDCVFARRIYQHPVYTVATVRAQQRWQEINAKHRTWFAGAYWGWGFHEDGARSAVRAAQSINEHFAA